MVNMKIVGLRNLKLFGGQGKTDGKLISVQPSYKFVVRGYNNNYWQRNAQSVPNQIR
jgi:hypothetical protein